MAVSLTSATEPHLVQPPQCRSATVTDYVIGWSDLGETKETVRDGIGQDRYSSSFPFAGRGYTTVDPQNVATYSTMSANSSGSMGLTRHAFA